MAMEPPDLSSLEIDEDHEMNNDEKEILESANDAIEKIRKSGNEINLIDEAIAASNAAKATKLKQQAQKREAESKEFGSGLANGMRENAEKRREKKIVVDAIREQGNQAFRNKDLEKALHLYSKAIESAGNSYDELGLIYGNRSLVYLKLNKADLALDDAEKSIALDKFWVKGYVRKATALKQLGKSRDAASCLEHGIRVFAERKESSILTSEYKTLLPQEYEVYCMPAIGADKTSKPNLELPEVQQAMLETLQSGGWANEDLLTTMMNNPILRQGLLDPRCSMLMQGLKNNPTETLKAYGNDPQVSKFLNELMKTLGTHFTNMGNVAETPNTSPPPAPPVDPEVSKVLSDPKVYEILSDPETRKVLENCGNPMQMQHYMRDPVWGPRIRILIENGLVKFES